MLRVTHQRYQLILGYDYLDKIKRGDTVVWFDKLAGYHRYIELDNPEALIVTCKREGRLYMRFLGERRGKATTMIRIENPPRARLYIVRFDDMTKRERIEYVTQRMKDYGTHGNV